MPESCEAFLVGEVADEAGDEPSLGRGVVPQEVVRRPGEPVRLPVRTGDRSGELGCLFKPGVAVSGKGGIGEAQHSVPIAVAGECLGVEVGRGAVPVARDKSVDVAVDEDVVELVVSRHHARSALTRTRDTSWSATCSKSSSTPSPGPVGTMIESPLNASGLTSRSLSRICRPKMSLG